MAYTTDQELLELQIGEFAYTGTLQDLFFLVDRIKDGDNLPSFFSALLALAELANDPDEAKAAMFRRNRPDKAMADK